VPTATFRVLFVLVILSHDRRKILHTNVTEHPTASWTARQVLEAIYGRAFSQRMASVGLTEVVTAPLSPWQNPYFERVIGSIRRECLHHTIIVGERHLRRVVRSYVQYYNGVRTQLSLDKDAPAHHPTHPPEVGSIRSKPHCGGLHHEYLRAAA
jgi:putative transposase